MRAANCVEVEDAAKRKFVANGRNVECAKYLVAGQGRNQCVESALGLHFDELVCKSVEWDDGTDEHVVIEEAIIFSVNIALVRQDVHHPLYGRKQARTLIVEWMAHTAVDQPNPKSETNRRSIERAFIIPKIVTRKFRAPRCFKWVA